jgi:hypothetical protein
MTVEGGSRHQGWHLFNEAITDLLNAKADR